MADKHPTPTSKSEMNSPVAHNAPGAKPTPAPNSPEKPKAAVFADGKMTGPYDDMLVGSGLNPGDTGFMQLTPEGVPSGLTNQIPDVGADVSVCRVLVRAPSSNSAQIVTPTGADLIPPLNPDPDFRVEFPADPASRVSKHDERRAAGKRAEAKVA